MADDESKVLTGFEVHTSKHSMLSTLHKAACKALALGGGSLAAVYPAYPMTVLYPARA